MFKPNTTTLIPTRFTLIESRHWFYCLFLGHPCFLRCSSYKFNILLFFTIFIFKVFKKRETWSKMSLRQVTRYVKLPAWIKDKFWREDRENSKHKTWKRSRKYFGYVQITTEGVCTTHDTSYKDIIYVISNTSVCLTIDNHLKYRES